MTAVLIVTAVLIIWSAVSLRAAKLLGGVTRFRDTQTPAAGAGGGTGDVPSPPARGARPLRSVP